MTHISLLRGIPIEWSSWESPMVSTSSYSVKIQSSIYGFGASRFLKSLVVELYLGNEVCVS